MQCGARPQRLARRSSVGELAVNVTRVTSLKLQSFRNELQVPTAQYLPLLKNESHALSPTFHGQRTWAQDLCIPKAPSTIQARSMNLWPLGPKTTQVQEPSDLAICWGKKAKRRTSEPSRYQALNLEGLQAAGKPLVCHHCSWRSRACRRQGARGCRAPVQLSESAYPAQMLSLRAGAVQALPMHPVSRVATLQFTTPHYSHYTMG